MIQQQMLEYQKIIGELNRIERDLKKSDANQRRRQYKELKLRYETDIAELDAKASDLKNQLAQAKALIAKITNVIDEHNKELNDVESSDELNYMDKKLAEQMKLLASVEKEIRKILQMGEELAKSFEEINAKLPKVVSAYATAKKEFEAETEKVRPRVLQLNAKRDELAKVIDPELFELYKRISAGKIFPVFVPLRDEVRCGGCQMEMPKAVVKSGMQAKGFMRCEHCGRIIYS